jgi:hypothetical protein
VTRVACIVEGDGEVRALPALVRRVAHDHGVYQVDVPPPFRLARGEFRDPIEFGRAVELQARRAGDVGGVLAVMDADDDCAVDLAKAIRASYQGGRRFALVAAVREYESILLAGHGVDPVRVERTRDGKGELRRLIGGYRASVHQAKLSAILDLDRARQCRWFRKFEKELLAILRG